MIFDTTAFAVGGFDTATSRSVTFFQRNRGACLPAGVASCNGIRSGKSRRAAKLVAPMKAIRFHQHGGPEVLRYEDAPTPEPGRGEVLVALRAAALNHLDLFTRNGDVPKVPLPHIGGADGAGGGAANGPGATRFPAGTRVFFDPGVSDGTCGYCARGERSLCGRWEILGEHRDGTYAQAVVMPEVNLRPIPEGLSFEEAAAFPLVFLTAWRMVVSKARVLPGGAGLLPGLRRGRRPA